MRKIANSVVAGALALASAALPVYAQTINVGGGAQNLGNIGSLTLPGLISGILRLLVIVAAVAFFFMLVLGGIQWILSGGDKQKTEAARNQITAALVGLVVVFSAWAIAQLIKTLFGVDLFNLQITAIPTS